MLRLRARSESDVAALLALLQRTHEEQRYPVRQEAVTASWLAPPDELAAWVAVDGGAVLGHAALHPVHRTSAVLWSRVPGRVVVLSRLFTDGSRRGTGLQLLDHAVGRAHGLGCTPVLEAWVQRPAVGWYVRRGWTSLGRTEQVWGTRHVVVEALVGPTVHDAARQR